MRPLAFATTASACAGGPMIAIDLPGAEPKVRATTTASQPHATSAMAPAIRPDGSSHFRGALLVVIEVLDARAPGLEVAVDVDKTVDPGLQAGPAKAGPGIKLQ